MTTEIAQQVYAGLLTRFEDGASVLTRVRRYPGDPWTRVQAGIDDAVGNIGNTKDRTPIIPKTLNYDDALELAVTQLTPKNVVAELQAFFFAWRGAIEFQGKGPMARAAMQLDAVTKTFAALALSCTLPTQPE